MSQVTITIFGATGTQGGAVIDHLLSEPNAAKYKIRGVTRDPSSKAAEDLRTRGVEVVQADFADKESLRNVVRGSEIVFGITMPSMEDIGKMLDSNIVHGEEIQGKNMADAVKAEGCKVFIWSSSASPTEISGGKYHIPGAESKSKVTKYLKEIGLPHITLNTAWFVENLWKMSFLQPNASGDGWEITVPCIKPDSPQRFVWAHETLGNAVLTVIKNYPKLLEQTLQIVTGVMTFTEFAEVLSKGSGVKVTYNYLPVANMGPIFSPIVNKTYTFLSEYGKGYGNTEPDPQVGTLEEFASTRFAEFIRAKTL